MATPIILELEDADAERRLRHVMEEALGCRWSERRARRVYYDTFDWRLAARGDSLFVESGASGEGGPWLRWRVGDDDASRRCRWTTDGVTSAGLREIPFGADLLTVLAPREPLPVVVVEREEVRYEVENRIGKTLVRASLVRAAVADPAADRSGSLPMRFEVSPLRGYRKQHRELVGRLRRELPGSVGAPGELEAALGIVGRRPGDRPLPSSLELDAEAPAGSEVERLLGALLEVVKANEDGTRRDLDPEFLHDFRVAQRRARVLLSRGRGVLPEAARAKLAKELKWLGGLTGPVRDLDVHLLDVPVNQQRLPAAEQERLQPLVDHLEKRQQEAQRRLARALDGTRYRRLLSNWRRLAEGRQTVAGEEGHPTALSLAHHRLQAAHRKVLERGREIDDDTPVSELHRLRIDCKKLRYLLEFFRSLLASGEVKVLVKHLKRLQDHLGRLHDLAVQRRAMESHAIEMSAGGEVPATTLLAIGRLITLADLDEESERRRFAKSFKGFAGGAGRRAAERLLGELEARS